MKNKTLALIDGFSLGGAETQLLSIEKYNVFEELTIIALEKNTFHLENKNYENIFFLYEKKFKNKLHKYLLFPFLLIQLLKLLYQLKKKMILQLFLF